MDRGDIYRVTLGPVKGHEQDGYRPVLIISPGKFNLVSHTPWVCPITNHGAFARNRGFAVELDERTKTQGIILCNQLRAIDMDARNGYLIETVPADIIEEVLAKIYTLLD